MRTTCVMLVRVADPPRRLDIGATDEPPTRLGDAAEYLWGLAERLGKNGVGLVERSSGARPRARQSWRRHARRRPM